MNWKLIASTLALSTLSTLVPACAADSSDGGPEVEEVSVDEEELTSALRKSLLGAYHGGPATAAPTFEGLVLREDGTFFADAGTGIVCIKAPCPTSARLEGRFTATPSYIRLIAKAKGGIGDSFYGWYRYTKKGDSLVLSSPWWSKTKWTQSLTKELSYCQAPSDCGGQALLVPACVGQWTCGQSQCGWDCSVTPSGGVWPSDATKVVTRSSGGGFTPPPPPGSTCALGASNVTLDLATRKLDWELCQFIDWKTPLTLVKGSRVVSAAEAASVVLAGKELAVTKNDFCGADKPWMEVKITSAAKGEQSYVDSFYACNGQGLTYVDNIEAIFGAMRDLAHP